MTLLEINGLNRSFGGLRAVRDVSFSVKQGSIKALIGPNGAGKTTLFNLISGYLPSESGTVTFRNRPIQGLKPYQIASRGMSRTFQHIRLFPKMSALENIMIGRHLHSSSEFISSMLSLPGTRREEKMIKESSLELMRSLGIDDLAQAESSSLAYGQQRIVELARALACEPVLLLLDEPAAGLNMGETDKMAELISNIRDRGVTLLIVEHDMSLVMNISDEIIVLSYGEKIADGTPAEIQKNEEVIRVYLGEEDA